MSEEQKPAATPKTDPAAKPAAKGEKAEKKKPHPMMVPFCIGMVGFVAFMISAPFWATDVKEARYVLIKQGYQPIEVGGYDHLSCGIDIYSTKFIAISPQGNRVKGAVCKTPHLTVPSIDDVELDQRKPPQP